MATSILSHRTEKHKPRKSLLELIGLLPMTNRDALMDALDSLDDAAFSKLLYRSESDFEPRVDYIICKGCKREHGGKCPAPDDEAVCLTQFDDWLGQPVTDYTFELIKEVFQVADFPRYLHPAAKAQSDYCEEHEIPLFAPDNGVCPCCGRDIYGEGGISEELAGKVHITCCPFCSTTFCD